MNLRQLTSGTPPQLPLPRPHQNHSQKKHRKNKAPFTQTRWFGMVCVGVTITYILYRVFSLGVSSGAAQSVFGHKPQNLICNQAPEQEGQSQNNGAAYLDSAYQYRVATQKPQGPNLIQNNSLEDYDGNIGSPNGFARTQETSQLDYHYTTDPGSGDHFLRVTDTSGNQRSGHGGWAADLVPIDASGTYAYGFMYRSNVALTLSIEYVSANNVHTYTNVTTLAATSGWHTFTAHFDNKDNAQQFRFLVIAQNSGQFDTKSYDVHKIPNAELPQGVVSLTFDDGWESYASKAVPLLRKYHMPSTTYVITDIAEKGQAEYMTMSNLQKLKKDDIDIGSHSLTHCDQTKLSPKDVATNATKSKAALESRRLGPVTSFAYPYGSYNQTTQDIYAKSFPYIRTSDVGYNDRYFDPQNIRSIAILNTTSDKELESELTYAANHKLWLVLAYHRINEIGEYNITTKQFEHQLQLIQKSGLKVENMQQATQNITTMR